MNRKTNSFPFFHFAGKKGSRGNSEITLISAASFKDDKCLGIHRIVFSLQSYVYWIKTMK